MTILTTIPNGANYGDIRASINQLLTDVATLKAGGTVTPTPTVTLSSAVSHPEGNSGTTAFVYTITRSVSTGAVNVPWAFAAGSTNASDYVGGALPTGGVVAFADGATTGTITINVAGDTTVEPDEQFTVSITAPAGYAAGTSMSATGTIVNDDTSAPVYAGKYLLKGDSIGAGYTASYAGFSNVSLGSNVTLINLSASGSTIEQAMIELSQLAQYYDPTKPCVVVYEEGTNSLGNNGDTADTAYYTSMVPLVNATKAMGFYVYLESVTPRADSNWNSGKETERLALNVLYSTPGDARADGFLNSAADSRLSTVTSTYYSDGLHLTNAGQDVKTALYQALGQTVMQLPPRAPNIFLSGRCPAGQVGTAYNFTPRTDGGTAPLTYALSGTLPAGLAFSTSTGAISGTPTAAGNAAGLSITVTDSTGKTSTLSSRSITIQAATANTQAVDPLTISGATYTTSGKFGAALSGGTGTVPTTVIANDQSNKPFTIEMFAAFPSPNTDLRVLMGSGWYVAQNGTQITIACDLSGSNEVSVAAHNAFDGAFHFWGIIVQAGSLEVLIDGVSVGSFTATTQPGQLTVKNVNGGYATSATIDQLAIFSGVRRTTTVPTAAYTGAEAGLLALYSLDNTLAGVKPA